MPKKDKDKSVDRIIDNRRARFDYAIGETLECGMKLFGGEVKSVRTGQVSLGEGYVRAEMEPPSLWLHGVNIADYAPARTKPADQPHAHAAPAGPQARDHADVEGPADQGQHSRAAEGLLQKWFCQMPDRRGHGPQEG